MFMICVLHTLLQGGVMTHCDFGRAVNWGQYYMCYALEILTFVCVDIYALIRVMLVIVQNLKYQK